MTKLEQLIRNLDLNSDNAYASLFKAFTHDLSMPILTCPIKANSFVFRIRQNQPDANYQKFGDISYPPQERVIGYSRANKPLQQVFYASDNFGTALTELMPYWSGRFNVGDKFAVTSGLWMLKTDIHLAIIPDLANERLMEFLSKSPALRTLTADAEYWEFVNSYFKAQGILNAGIYKFTSAFCNALINNVTTLGDKVAGILYTSAQDPTGWNVALTPQIVDECLSMNNVVKHIIQRDGTRNGKPTYNNFATPVIAKSLDHSTENISW